MPKKKAKRNPRVCHDERPTLSSPKPLTLALILEHECSSPEDWKAYQEFSQEDQFWHSLPREERAKVKQPEWTGWNIYRITLHCNIIEVVARKLPSGVGYEVREYLIRDH